MLLQRIKNRARAVYYPFNEINYLHVIVDGTIVLAPIVGIVAYILYLG